ncbi:peptidase E [Algibacter amylolyticus]|uniref:Peptidase E n=1 Tax=Algibacter amylolyticus TaxID=1608400 RepID=A0A5M7BA46_9FLAO|nr:DUF6702 family protein [Algibacter amylolyticus]KAA5824155.1 peptidase E [Algibacter amylolyticus]MBB5269713.1 hypothetical protein [Algibacter amylolyticus]TSJ74632.1 peptidase E [Algibacter amylolyticus]
MKVFKYLIILLVLPLFAFTTMHKYYISVTQVNYVKEKESLQIISRIFIDDFESVLRSNYDKNIILAVKDEPKETDSLMNIYLQSKLKIKINDKPVLFNFIGKAYDGDIVRCYLEVEHVKYIDVLSITNSILLDYQEDQQNIVKTKINSKTKSFILTSNNTSALLNFN